MSATITRQPPSSARPAPVGLDAQFARLAGQLEQLKMQVRQAQQLSNLGTAAATIVHEFNNLLVPMLSYARYAQANDDPVMLRKAVETTINTGQVLVAMSDRLLRLSAAKATELALTPLAPIADEAVACLCRDFQKDGISFAQRIDEGLEVWADPLHLQQVFFNLLLNARAALAKQHGGQLVVEAKRAGDEAVIEVRDTGPGIAPDIVGRLFDPFATTRKADGKGRARCGGLGLSLCKDIVEESGGSIAVSSEVGVGTTFTIRLPARVPDGAAGEAAA